MGSETWLPAALVVGGYLIGSIPFGVLASKALGAADPRTAGSRNIGFTNVLRVSGTKAGVLTLIGDGGKGWLMGWLAAHVLEGEGAIFISALAVILGHLYSVFLRLKGGKGVATAIGAVTGVAWPIGLATLALWGVGAASTRISSVGALVAFGGLPVVAVMAGKSMGFVIFSICVSLLIVFKHKENIRRLVEGKEPRMGAGRHD